MSQNDTELLAGNGNNIILFPRKPVECNGFKHGGSTKKE